MKKVSADQVNDFMSDEQAKYFVEESNRVADKTKRVVVNVDTLSQYFEANAKITLEEIKRVVPNIDNKATYYKVLALLHLKFHAYNLP